MAKEPAERYATALELGTLLKRIRESGRAGATDATIGRADAAHSDESQSDESQSDESRSDESQSDESETNDARSEPDSIDVDRPASRRGALIAMVLVLIAIAAAGIFFAIRAGQGRSDAADAAPSLPPPERTEWQFSSVEKQFSYSVSMTPSPAAAGKPISVRISLGAADAPLADAIRAGNATALVEIFGAGKRSELRAELTITASRDLDGPIVLSPSVVGTYRVVVTLRAGARPLGQTSFDICIGGDPLGDPLALAKVCPNMNSNRE